MPRTLRLTSPHMRGEDVKAVQRALRVRPDGAYGPVTGSNVRAWKYRAGYPLKACNTGIGPDGQAMLLGRRRLPAAYRVRAVARKARGYVAGRGLPRMGATERRWAALNVMLRWARNGLTEDPAGSNRVPELSKAGASLGVPDGLTRMGWPWCAYAVMLACLEAGFPTARDGLIRWRFNPLYTVDILAKAQAGQFGMRLVGADEVEPGDLVLFKLSGSGDPVDHIGMVLARPRNGTVQTVEGNTSAGDRGSQNNGGGVYQRVRATSTVRGYVRLAAD